MKREMTSEQLTGNTSEYLLVNFDKEDRYDKRNKKRKKNTQDSTRQGLNPDHVPQHGAIFQLSLASQRHPDRYSLRTLSHGSSRFNLPLEIPESLRWKS